MLAPITYDVSIDSFMLLCVKVKKRVTTVMPTRPMRAKGTIESGLISGSLMPWFRFIALVATQSENGPPTTVPTMHLTKIKKIRHSAYSTDRVWLCELVTVSN